MTNTAMFLNAVKGKGIKLNYIAKKLNLTPYGLSKKINNQSEFKASEIVLITDILSLSIEARDNIFLSDV